MASAAYLRRQAEVCLRLSLAASNNEVSNRLMVMAKEYNEKAAALEATLPPAQVRESLPDSEGYC
jgi:adenine C2-methylase RlmN of 23S rRNA A2503 and tRNA A37